MVSSSNPWHWYQNANSFMALSIIITDHLDAEGPDTDIRFLVAAGTLPTIASISIELFLKAYLLASEKRLKEIRKFNHDLEKLRKECEKLDPTAFADRDLIDVCGNYGTSVTINGGSKYPTNSAPHILTTAYAYTLRHLKEITRQKINSLGKIHDQI